MQPSTPTPQYATARGTWRVEARTLYLDGLGKGVGANLPSGNGPVPGANVVVEKALRGNLLHGLQLPMRRTWGELSEEVFIGRVREQDRGAWVFGSAEPFDEGEPAEVAIDPTFP